MDKQLRIPTQGIPIWKRVEGWVWCDNHDEVHTDQADQYHPGDTDRWRPLWITKETR